MSKTLRRYTIFVMLISLAMVGCSDSIQPSLLSSGKTPHVYGRIDNARRVNNDVVSFFVVGDPAQAAIYKNAAVGTTNQTRIFRQSGGIHTRATVADLKDGTQIIVFFTGAIGASSPVQGKAIEITIVE